MCRCKMMNSALNQNLQYSNPLDVQYVGNDWTTQRFETVHFLVLPCAAEKSISACGRERADIHRSLSLLKEENTKMVIPSATLLRDSQ